MAHVTVGVQFPHIHLLALVIDTHATDFSIPALPNAIVFCPLFPKKFTKKAQQ
jgi:hypothetical protein